MVKLIIILMIIAGLWQSGKGWLLKKNKDLSDETFTEMKSLTIEEYEKAKDKMIIQGLVYTGVALLLFILTF